MLVRITMSSLYNSSGQAQLLMLGRDVIGLGVLELDLVGASNWRGACNHVVTTTFSEA
jgi:hypothetical protein